MKFHFDFHFHFHGSPSSAVEPAEVTTSLPAPVTDTRMMTGAGGNQSASASAPPGDAADQGGPLPAEGPPTLTTDEWLDKLKLAAVQGMIRLQNTWEKIPKGQRQILKFELERLKPKANDADQMAARTRA